MGRPKKPGQCKFTLEELANFICEYTGDGTKRNHRDVVNWFRWFEEKCGCSESYIYIRGSNKL